MRNKPTVSMLCFLSLVATIFMVSPLRAQNTPADHFARGKRLIEDNCIDCMGGTQQGEEDGIRELEMALQAHYEKPVDVYKLLADAYANMSTYVEKSQSSLRHSGARSMRSIGSSTGLLRMTRRF